MLIASAVAAAVVLTVVAAYFLTLLTVYDQLDRELVEAMATMHAKLAPKVPGLMWDDAE